VRLRVRSRGRRRCGHAVLTPALSAPIGPAGGEPTAMRSRPSWNPPGRRVSGRRAGGDGDVVTSVPAGFDSGDPIAPATVPRDGRAHRSGLRRPRRELIDHAGRGPIHRRGRPAAAGPVAEQDHVTRFAEGEARPDGRARRPHRQDAIRPRRRAGTAVPVDVAVEEGNPGRSRWCRTLPGRRGADGGADGTDAGGDASGAVRPGWDGPDHAPCQQGDANDPEDGGNPRRRGVGRRRRRGGENINRNVI